MPDLGEDLLFEVTLLDGGDGSFINLALGQMVLSTLSFHKEKNHPPPLRRAHAVLNS